MPSISGTVFISDANAAPETDIVVQVYGIGLVNKQLLGEVTLQVPFRNSSQTFRIRYSSRQYQSAEGSGTADTQVQARTLDGLLVGETEIIFNAPDEVVDIRLELHPVENPASEFERLVASLMPLMEDIDPAALTLEQITFLARDSQQRSSRIITWNEAAMLSRDHGIPIEAGYGWWRRLGQPHTLAGLLAQEGGLLRSTLIGAIRSNIIPDIADRIDAILAQLNGLRTRVVFGSFNFDPPSRTEIDTDVIVQAFDRDFRSEQLLGEIRIAGPFGSPGSTATGRYRIEYSEAQFQLNEARSADIIVRGRTEDDRYAVESEPHFNAGSEAHIDLTLIAAQSPEVETPTPSELEQLQTDLELIRENVPYATFTDDDLQFLVQELLQSNSRVEQASLQQRLDFLRIAAQFEQTISVPLAAFYGWFRQSLPTDLAALLDTPSTGLQTVLETAIREAIIPDITAQIPEILDAIHSARIEQGRIVNHRFVVQLINAQNNRPLGNILANVIDLDAESDVQDSGVVNIDGQGILVLDFVLPGDAPSDTSRRLQLTLNDEERILATIEINAVAEQNEVAVIQVTVEATAEEQTAISDLASAGLTARLRDRGIATFDDLLSNPNMDVGDDDDNEELTRLRDRAKITVLNPDLTEAQQTYLFNNGLASPQTIARVSRAEFVSRHSEGLGGDAAAYTFYKANQDLVKVMHHQVAGNWLEIVTSPDDGNNDDSEIPTGVREVIEAQINNCGCEDCTTAVSPAAYMAYLLDWMLTHVKYQGATVTFGDFVNEFHQPFAGLPTHCDAVTQEVRQVRLVVESLWRFIGRLGESDLQMPTPFRNAYRRLRNQLYKTIMTNMGVSFEQLRRASLTIEGNAPTSDFTAEQAAAQLSAVANIIGVVESVVPELFFNVDNPSINPTEDLLETTFGYVNTRKQNRFATRSRPQLITWQREKLENQWQIQDWMPDDYNSTNRLPYIDPALIDASYLRTPFDINPAYALLTQRQTLLTSHRLGMVESTTTDLAGLDTLLASELSQTIEQLQTWFNALQGEGDENAVTDASEAITTLHLTPAGFSHLMAIHSTLTSGTALGDTADESEAVWNSVFDILSYAYRHQQFTAWVEQENDAEIVFGPKLFWPSVEPLTINAWLASDSELDAWLTALEQRNQPPIIDPDQIPQVWILVLRVARDIQNSEEEQSADNSFTAGIGGLAIETSLDAFERWERRRAFVDERIDDLHTAHQGATSRLDALGNMLAASNTGLTLETLLELREQEAAGQDIASRLAQFTLGLSSYRFLAEVHTLAEEDSSIPENMWEGAEAILVQVEKQREFAEWRNQEQEAQIALHPNQFQILTPPNEVADSVRSEWLHNTRDLNRWVATLEARKDQFETLETALANAVSAAESQVLMQLRDLLISDSAAPGDSFLEKAEWINKRLLMDMSMGGCQMTTRVSHAIETLQRLIRGVYTREYIGSLLEDFALDAVEDYEAEWPVMGAYATWRAYMQAYLFPENLLHLSPTPRQSHGFMNFKQNLSKVRKPSDACIVAEEYSQYFTDISNLEIQATCEAVGIPDATSECEEIQYISKALVYMFAYSSFSKSVYMGTFESQSDIRNSISSWRVIPKLDNILEVVGVISKTTLAGEKLINLFVKTKENSKIKLKVISYNRATSQWKRAWSASKTLDLPPGQYTNFSVVVIQKYAGPISSGLVEQVPMVVAIRLANGSVFLRNFISVDAGWELSDWIPLFGDHLSERFTKLCGLIQFRNTDFLLFLEDRKGRIHYRLFSTQNNKDDGFWFGIFNGGNFNAILAWKNSYDIYLIGKTFSNLPYSLFRQVGNLGYRIIDSVSLLNSWLIDVAGVSLQDFYLTNDDWAPPVLPDSEDPQYEGNLFDLLTLQPSRWDWEPKHGGDKTFFLPIIQKQALEQFSNIVKDLEQVDYFDVNHGKWKIANLYVKKLIDDSGIGVILEKIYKGDSVSPRFRDKSQEFQFVGTLQSQNGSLNSIKSIPFSSEESSPKLSANGSRDIVVNRSSGDFHAVSQRSGVSISLSSLRRITLNHHDGDSLSLKPVSSQSSLQLRRSEIKQIYIKNSGFHAALSSYLSEAFNLIPVSLGYQLQKSGYFSEALLWYRQVYDYLQSSGKRKIDHSLKLEQSLNLDYDNAEDWLDDASNPHAIAATRKNTYTRHILLVIIRCLIDYADALFARDNVADNIRARELYTQALKLLDFKALKPKKSTCENILGELEVEVNGSGQLPLQQFQSVITEIPDTDRLRATVDNLKAIRWDTTISDVDSRVNAMRAAISSGLSSVRAEAVELPLAKSLSTIVEQNKPQVYAMLEAQYLSNSVPRSLFRKANRQRKQTQLSALASVTDTSQNSIPWLRQARPTEEADNELSLAVLKPEVLSRLAVLDQIHQTAPLQSLVTQQFSSFAINSGVSFSFCIPQNPVISALLRRAENNLTKLRTCRNIAGFLRQVDPYGAPITIGNGMVSADGSLFTGVVDAPPTPYRYATLIARAKELVNIAQQIEGGYQSALEASEREALSVLQAEQNIELAGTRVVLQELRINQANSQLGLANLQKGSAELREQTYGDWINAGKNEHEKNLLEAYREAGEAQQAANAARTTAQIAGVTATAIENFGNSFGANTGFRLAQGAAILAEGIANGYAINAQTRSQISSFEASFERRNNEWQLQQGLAGQDILIGDQQIQLARDGIAITQQERAIAELEQTHAANILQFLLSKTFTGDMYRWIASVLEGVYRYFLQEAASIARLAQQQLAFERQQGALKLIQSDYWNVPLDGTSQSDNTDRLGITGSARLLKDIYQLDQYAFETRQLKQSVSVTLDLAELFPFEFQQFRETGVLVFDTPQSLLERQFPGNYLCLTQQVTVSVVALIPPTYGILASLTSAGISQIVVGGDTFQAVTLRQLPERFALTSPTTTSGQILDLQPDTQTLQRPFEGTGFATQWQLLMPKASNIFDYNTIATVLFTVDFTALHSFDYEQQVIEQLDRNISANRAFRFRNEFADAWYDLSNPDQTGMPMVVRFQTRRDDFPPNVRDLRIQHLILYFIRKDGETYEVPVRQLQFIEEGTLGASGGGAQTIDGVISTRRGNGASWLSMIGKSPFGEWELAFADELSDTLSNGLRVRDLFSQDLIEDILLIITYKGTTPEHP